MKKKNKIIRRKPRRRTIGNKISVVNTNNEDISKKLLFKGTYRDYNYVYNQAIKDVEDEIDKIYSKWNSVDGYYTVELIVDFKQRLKDLRK